jgi:hypothetical protein
LAIITGGEIGTRRDMALKIANEGCIVATLDISIGEAGETVTPCHVTALKQVKNTTWIR